MLVAEHAPADAEDHRPVPLHQGLEGQLGAVLVPGGEPRQELGIRQPGECAQVPQPMNVPEQSGPSARHVRSLPGDSSCFNVMPGSGLRLTDFPGEAGRRLVLQSGWTAWNPPVDRLPRRSGKDAFDFLRRLAIDAGKCPGRDRKGSRRGQRDASWPAVQYPAVQPGLRRDACRAVPGVLSGPSFGECVDHTWSKRSFSTRGCKRSCCAGRIDSGPPIDRGNAQPGSIGVDFGRFEIHLWDEVRPMTLETRPE